MEYKPWPLILLAFVHFIEPISKIAFYSIFFQLSPLDAIVIEYQSGSAIQTFEFFFLFPIAGIALFAVKKWSFPLFVLVEVWVFITNLTYFNELYQSNQIWLLGFFIFFGILNIAVVGYLLLPAVRIAYLDPRVRWWEAKPRYSINIEGKVDGQTTGTIVNISESGIFIAAHRNLPIDSEIELEFTLFESAALSQDFHIKLKALVVHKFTVDNVEGYGIRYIELSVSNRHLIRSMIRHLERANVTRRPPRRNAMDLIRWLTTLIKTGKGLFPVNELNVMRKSGSS